jgi:hypothetical protein
MKNTMITVAATTVTIALLVSSMGIESLSHQTGSTSPVGSTSLTPLESAVWQVETGQCPGPDCPLGDGGNALGPLQIWRIAWTDVQRPGESYEDCKDLDYSVEIFRRYTARYATAKRLGHEPTNEDLARIWNGGPNGFKKTSTKIYWSKVNKEMTQND